MTAAPEPQLDVLVVNYLTGALAAQAGRNLVGPATRVWVCDNSGEMDADEVAAWGGTLVSPGRNTMYAGGNNLLYDRSGAPLVLLLNPDVTCSPATVQTLVVALQRNEDAWAVVPRLLDPDGTDQDYVRRLPTSASMLCDRVPPLRRLLRRSWDHHVYADLDPSRTQVVESPPGACVLLRRDRVGAQLFDEQFPLFFNDTDLSRRMSAEGQHVLLVAEATVTHLRHASLDQERERNRYSVSLSYDRSARRYARRHLRAWPLLWVVSWVREQVALRRGAELLG